jgi:ABC-type multidrug transport system ATPase subunit
MVISIENLGKKFRNEWIFRNFSYEFTIGKSYAITGPNGSGKSTLLQAIASYIPANEGVIKYANDNNQNIEIENIVKYLSITSPLLELIEEFTLTEFINFHQKLKPFSKEFNAGAFIQLLGFDTHGHKQIKFFSSGMKQKLKLGLCLFSQSKILLLDEPTTNLDQATKNWFLENIKNISKNKLIILASNDPHEYIFANEIIDIQMFK